jgi:hypothetical protein
LHKREQHAADYFATPLSTPQTLRIRRGEEAARRSVILRRLVDHGLFFHPD